MSHSRRDFLKASLGASSLISLGPTVPVFLARSALAAPSRRDAEGTVLIVVQLSGGNDGLNTVVPYADDEYARNRSTLRLPERDLHKIDSLLGFHPRMKGFARLFDQGHLSVVQGVGYPNPNQDHAGAMQNWHTARPNQANRQTGWLGRAADGLLDDDATDVPAAFLGPIAQPFALGAEKAVIPSIRSLGQSTLQAMPGPDGGRSHRKRLVEAAELPRPDDDNPLLGFLQRRSLRAYAASRQVEAVAQTVAQTVAQPAAQTTAKSADYPRFQLARTFRMVAQLIRADLGIRIYYTELGGGGIGGFDNHANQLGNHCAMLEQLSESVAALVDDLKADHLLDRVLLMTFSEFGRTVAENGRRGTGHGSAAPMFLAGGRLKAGLVGTHPNLTDLEGGGQKFHTDFRRVYATVLDCWLGIDSRTVLGEPFEPLDLLRS